MKGSLRLEFVMFRCVSVVLWQTTVFPMELLRQLSKYGDGTVLGAGMKKSMYFKYKYNCFV